MAGLALITISFFVNVLAIFLQTCTCEYSLPPAHLYTEARFPAKSPAVVYVPVCSPDCFKPSHLHPSHLSSICQSKAHLGNLPLQEHTQNYVNLGSRHSVKSDYQSGSSSYLNAHREEGSATVYQQNTHHGSEQKTSIQHHGSGVSQQHFQQQHQHGLQQDISGQVHDHHGYESEAEYHKKNDNVQYQFEYSVQDHKTGDVKRHREERKGDVVNGEYSLLEEDGNVRTVKYYADWKSGFHAQIHNTKPK